MGTVTFVDETSYGVRGDAWMLHVAEERLTLRELVRRRVFQEVAEYNARRGGTFQGLVQPTDAEVTLNGHAQGAPRRIDPERQFELTVEAIGRNGFLIFVDDCQIEELDEEIDLALDTGVVFLRLLALAGG
ncbi:hypothetical protein ACFWP5_41490 [Streptomyces sp. NPDC058469]|uniref:hypothetical protein n=1 Tax=Streptomyces sp. NPDC058469 TaxID=3346514 RepID=UPI0036612C0D